MSIGKRPHKTDIQFDGDKYLKTELVNSKVEVSTSENSIDFKKQVNIQDSESEAPNSDWLHTIKDFAGNIIMGIDRYGRSFWYGTVGYASGIMQFFSNNKKYAEFSTSQGNGFFKLFNNSEEEKVKLSSYEDNILGQKLQIPEGTENNHAVRKSQLDLKADKSITLQIGETTYDLSENRVFPLPIGSGGYEANVYLTNIDSANSGYKKIAYIPEATETIKSIVATNNTVLGEKYLYDSQIGITNIPSGEWKFKLYGRISSTSGGTSTVTIRVFRYLENGTEVDLVFGSKVISNTTNDTIQFTSTQAGNVDSNLTDRLGIQISLTTTMSTATTFYYSLGDGNAAYINSPLPLRHELLRDIEWLSSGHKGTANKLAGFDSFGNAAEIGLPVQKNTGETYYISDTEPSDTWESGKKSFKTWAGFLAQLDTNIIRYYTRTGTTTNASATITTADTSNLKVGQRVTGIGIPYDSFVQSIVSNTSFTINNTCTASGTVTITNWVGIWVEMFGAIEITSSITNLDGVYFNNTKAYITYGNFPLYKQTVSRLTPFVIIGGYTNGTGADSRLYYKYSGAPEYGDDFISNVNAVSKCTNELIYCFQASSSGRLLSIQNCNLRANYGTVLVSSHVNTIITGGYRYGLLGGCRVTGYKWYASGQLETPVAIDAYYIANSNGYIVSDEQITGCINNVATHVNLTFNGNIKGNTIKAGGDSESHSFNGMVDVTNINITGSATFNVISQANKLNCNDAYNRSPVIVKKMMGNEITTNNYAHVVINTTERGDAGLIITSKNNSVVELHGYKNGTAYVILKCQNTSTIKIFGEYLCQISENAGTIICERSGKLTSLRKAAASTGTILIKGKLDFYRDVAEATNNTPTIPLASGGKFRAEASADISCSYSDSKSGIVQKLADNTRVELVGYPLIKVSNGLSPIQILSNSGTAQDVHIAQANSNCNGTTYGLKLIFGDTTYGTTYAPNDVLNGVVFENTLLT